MEKKIITTIINIKQNNLLIKFHQGELVTELTTLDEISRYTLLCSCILPTLQLNNLLIYYYSADQ